MEPAERMLREIDQLRDSLVELTQELIRIPTLNPPGANYLQICEFLRRRLLQSGFEVELMRAVGAPADSDRYPRYNLLARRKGALPGDCVHFNSHTDVVQVGEGWTVDPFAGQVRGERLFGRGACDMKGGLAASIIAVEAFTACCPNFAGAIEVSATADEESGGFGGVAWLAERGWFSPQRVQHVIIPEPLNKDRICLGHRGVWWAEIETKGRIAHGSMPFLGDCAVRHMGAVIAEMEQSLFPALAQTRTGMPVVPPEAKQPSLNINSIHGGEPEQDCDFSGFPAPCVPDRCRMIVDRRFVAEESLAEVRSELSDLLQRVKESRPGMGVELRELFSVLPVLTEKDAPVVRSVGKAIRSVFDKAPDYVVSPGTYDQKHIDRIGRLKNCIAYGPGRIDLAHQPDEWIGIGDMLDSAKVMALTLVDLLKPG
ncbi:MAG: acetylornithine deacetylase/succinyl-diaminopimelate desuccinylase family protein [Rhodobacteraceae bacterium]|nr:acetylornithine deacetylase/succinyl-diaminopimelate desuccinylase family protein [Paracoccaceae bacterium]